jgi:hypothetical protein
MNGERKGVMDKARDKRSRRAAVRGEEISRGTAPPEASPGLVGQVKDGVAGAARGLGKAVQRVARGVGGAIREESE